MYYTGSRSPQREWAICGGVHPTEKHCDSLIRHMQQKIDKKELFQTIPMHTMNRGDNAGQEKEGSTASSINCDRRRHLYLAASGC